MARRPSKDFNRPETMAVNRADLAELASSFTGGANDMDNDTIAGGLKKTAEMLEYGFRLESYKGSLYHALHYALLSMSEDIKAADPQSDSIEVRQFHLELIKSSYCQLSEAALQMAGAPIGEGNAILNMMLPNGGEGHASDELKPQANNLRQAIGNFDAFFEKYPVEESSHQTIDFFTDPAPGHKPS